MTSSGLQFHLAVFSFVLSDLLAMDLRVDPLGLANLLTMSFPIPLVLCERLLATHLFPKAGSLTIGLQFQLQLVLLACLHVVVVACAFGFAFNNICEKATNSPFLALFKIVKCSVEYSDRIFRYCSPFHLLGIVFNNRQSRFKNIAFIVPLSIITTTRLRIKPTDLMIDK